ncbi:MAG: hypothetical protein ACRDV9_13445 [Acidimicrobiia bacterium]
MLLSELVATSEAVATVAARSAKVVALAALLAELEPEEVTSAVSFLTGEPRQGRIGIGWAALAPTASLSPALIASLTISDLDRSLDAGAFSSTPECSSRSDWAGARAGP